MNGALLLSQWHQRSPPEGADEDLTVAQRSQMIGLLLVAREAIEEDEGSDALVRRPRWRLRPSHLASPRAQRLGQAFVRVPALHVPFPLKARSRAL
jgi:hypothetical protein